MKYRLIILLAIGSLVSLIYSGCGDCNEYQVEISGIDDIYIFNSETNYPVDTVNCLHLGFNTSFLTRKISYNKPFSFIKTAMADECPTPAPILNFDSIKVFSIAKLNQEDVTKYCSIAISYDSIRPLNNVTPNFYNSIYIMAYGYLRFHLKKQITVSDHYQYLFQFFDKNGKKFEYTTDSVFLTN